jgi:hypothetical protein
MYKRKTSMGGAHVAKLNVGRPSQQLHFQLLQDSTSHRLTPKSQY